MEGAEARDFFRTRTAALAHHDLKLCLLPFPLQVVRSALGRNVLSRVLKVVRQLRPKLAVFEFQTPIPFASSVGSRTSWREFLGALEVSAASIRFQSWGP